MNRIYSLGILALSVALVTACQPYDQQDHRPNHNRGTQYGYRGDQDTTNDSERPPRPRVSADQQAAADAAANSAPVAPKPTPPPGVTTAHNPMHSAVANGPKQLLYGKPVPGKPGFLTSPYSPNAGLIDARGLPPGSEIKDAFTPGKTILVP